MGSEDKVRKVLEALVRLSDWESEEARSLLRRAHDEFLALAFTSEIEREIWLAIVAIAAELEWYAAIILWVDEGKRGDPNDYRLRSLDDAIRKLEGRGLLSERTYEILKRIRCLRNAIAHRKAVGQLGVSAPDWKEIGYEVGGEKFNVFVFPFAFNRLLEDALGAKEAMAAWLTEHG